MTVTDAQSPLLEVHDLKTHLFTEEGVLRAVDGVSWSVDRGQIMALVGESGCGKSLTALSLMRLVPTPPGRIVAGRVMFEGQNLLELSEKRMRALRGNRLAMIFQEPTTSLNPVYTVGDQIAEAVELHRRLSGKAAMSVAVDMLDKVGIAEPKQRACDYPHQLSGGMQQRVMIAMALSCNPSLLIADEPTTALDVTVQAQILELLARLQQETHMAIILITHDLGMVAQVADFVCVMYAGRIVERAAVGELFANPLHPYTQALLECVPKLDGERTRLEVIPGSVPDPRAFPPGCTFHPRCSLTRTKAADTQRPTFAIQTHDRATVLRRCVEATDAEPGGTPHLKEVAPEHFVACWETPAPHPA